MADRAFEVELDRMFAGHPAFPDADAFAARVESRLDRVWTMRRLLIGVLGITGGLIGGAQVLGSGFVQRVDALTAQTRQVVSIELADFTSSRVLPGGLAVNGEILWMSAVLGALAIGFVITRAVRDI